MKTLAVMALVVCLAALSCAGLEGRVPETEPRIRELTGVYTDPNRHTWQVSTPYLTGGWPFEHDYCLRCSGAGRAAGTIEIYVIATSSLGWPELSLAEDSDGRVLPLERRGRDVVDMPFQPPMFCEHVAVTVSRVYLEAHRQTPVRLRLRGVRGELELNLAPAAINAFLQVLDAHLAAP